MDILSPSERSKRMSLIRSSNTKVERIVFSELRRRKIYFQRHYKNAPGKPDIALPRKKKAVFIDGDFWHGRDFHRIARTRVADDYWTKKIMYNMERDRSQLEELVGKGWLVLRVWESDIKRKRTRESEIEKIVNFLKDDNSSAG